MRFLGVILHEKHDSDFIFTPNASAIVKMKTKWRFNIQSAGYKEILQGQILWEGVTATFTGRSYMEV